MAYITNTKLSLEDITSVNIPSTDALPIDLKKLKGEATQSAEPTPSSPVSIETVTGRQEINVVGKNLLNTNLMTEFTPTQVTWHSLDGVTGFYNVTNIAKSNIYYDIKANKTYTFSVHQYNNINTSSNAPIQLVRGDNASLVCSLTASSSFEPVSFTPTEDLRVYPRISVGSANVETQCIVQLEVGSTATTYEPYINKSYEINLGKNLYKPISFSRSNGGIDYTYNLDGSINCDGRATSNSYSMLSTDAPTYMFQINTGTYTISGASTSIRLQVIKYDNGSVSTLANTTSSTSFTVNSPTNVYIRAYISNGTTVDNVKVYPQLEKGSQATEYISYFEPIELCKTGDYQDYIYKNNGNWYIHKEINKIVLNGSESGWTVYGTGTANYFYRRTITPLMKTGGVSALTSHYPYTGVYTANTNQGLYISATETTSQLRIRYGTEDTLDNFKNWLFNNNVSVYYVLETPTDTIIENETLISELETLSNAYSFRPSTNIIQTTQNLPFYIDLDVYSGENVYQDVIYSQEDVNKCKLYFNNVEIETLTGKEADDLLEKITFTKRILPENGKKVFGLDNFIAEEVEIVIHDIDTTIIQDKVRIDLCTLVDELTDTYQYITMGIYNIQDTPTRNDNKITIKLRDNACLFDFNYNGKELMDRQGGSATKMQILQDICSKANVNCNVSSFTGDSDVTGTYDSSVKARMYVAYLAEQAGCIAKIDRYGNLIFIPLNSLYTQRIPLSICSKYVKGTPFQIERVVYELGTIKFETSNDETLPTLYISSENPFISVQNDIDRILPLVKDFTLDSAEITSEIIGNPAIDGYDLIEVYDDEDVNEPVLFRTFANNTLTYNGKFKSKYKVEIGLEERTENTTNTGEVIFQKTIKQEIDRTNGILTTTVTEVKEQNEQLNGTPTYIITPDTTFQTDKPYYKLDNDTYVLLIEGTDYNDGDAITSVGYDVYNVKYEDSMSDVVDKKISDAIKEAGPKIVSSALTQSSDKFTMWFDETAYSKDIKDIKEQTNKNKENISDIKAFIEYGRIGDSPYILLGSPEANTKLRLLNTQIQFITNNEEVIAYISNQKLYINENDIVKKQVLGDENSGKWITEVDSQGNLNTYWGG